MSNFSKALSKLAALSTLKAGWNYGSGLPLRSEPLRLGTFVIAHLQNIGASRFDVLPSSDGGATILASMHSSLAEIVVMGDGSMNLFLETGDDEVDYEGLQFGELIGILEKHGWRSPTSYVSHTHSFIVENTSVSPAKPFRLTGLGHRLSTLPVLRRQASPFVIISESIIPELEENPQFSSDSPSQTCQMALS